MPTLDSQQTGSGAGQRYQHSTANGLAPVQAQRVTTTPTPDSQQTGSSAGLAVTATPTPDRQAPVRACTSAPARWSPPWQRCRRTGCWPATVAPPISCATSVLSSTWPAAISSAHRSVGGLDSAASGPSAVRLAMVRSRDDSRTRPPAADRVAGSAQDARLGWVLQTRGSGINWMSARCRLRWAAAFALLRVGVRPPGCVVVGRGGVRARVAGRRRMRLGWLGGRPCVLGSRSGVG